MPGFHIQMDGRDAGRGPNSNIETARKHRWRIEVFDPLNPILLYAHKADRPRPEISLMTVHHGQDRIFVPGQNFWQPIDITFYETMRGLRNETAQLIYQWWSKSVIDLERSRAADVNKKDATLIQYDGKGDMIYTYLLYGCLVTRVTPDPSDYSESAISEITFTMNVDKVVEKPGGGGGGLYGDSF